MTIYLLSTSKRRNEADLRKQIKMLLRNPKREGDLQRIKTIRYVLQNLIQKTMAPLFLLKKAEGDQRDLTKRSKEQLKELQDEVVVDQKRRRKNQKVLVKRKMNKTRRRKKRRRINDKKINSMHQTYSLNLFKKLITNFKFLSLLCIS